MLKSKRCIIISMTLDEKIRFGMVAVGGASIVLTALGLHAGPISIAGGAGD
jgi:hypothetical protein